MGEEPEEEEDEELYRLISKAKRNWISHMSENEEEEDGLLYRYFIKPFEYSGKTEPATKAGDESHDLNEDKPPKKTNDKAATADDEAADEEGGDDDDEGDDDDDEELYRERGFLAR